MGSKKNSMKNNMDSLVDEMHLNKDDNKISKKKKSGRKFQSIKVAPINQSDLDGIDDDEELDHIADIPIIESKKDKAKRLKNEEKLARKEEVKKLKESGMKKNKDGIWESAEEREQRQQYKKSKKEKKERKRIKKSEKNKLRSLKASQGLDGSLTDMDQVLGSL